MSNGCDNSQNEGIADDLANFHFHTFLLQHVNERQELVLKEREIKERVWIFHL